MLLGRARNLVRANRLQKGNKKGFVHEFENGSYGVLELGWRRRRRSARDIEESVSDARREVDLTGSAGCDICLH